MSKEVTLPSGAKLAINAAPFASSKALYQAVLEEVRGVNLSSDRDLDANFFKDLACIMFSSKKIEPKLWECLERATYNGNRIVPDTFEPEDAREDYTSVCVEVAEVNLRPFMKSLFAESRRLREKLEGTQPAK